MPTATEFFGITAWNLGPLTTTYTAPSSCATNIKHPVFVNAISPYSALAFPSNQYRYAECLSTLGPVSSYTYSEHCMVYGRGGEITVISSVNGLAYSDGVLSRMEPTRASDYTLTTVNLGAVVGETGNGFSDIALATWVPAIPLVYKKLDIAKAKGESDESGSGTGTATDDGGGDNAASTIQRQGSIVVLGLLSEILVGTSILFS
ncbi:hypothetical protein HYE67_000100 [Fusarium culmorum]|uniref:Uncharacterized protein n=1 Tax=Fusarium culmorum TaxID=5516 RepID=A0A2T4GC78_FUSCU|nr:hypothetical protein FCULG_00012726 [Fusarium culmorum]QPC57869.1 hypothetical protein HYE67_000100 [Fusarium culmorum]